MLWPPGEMHISFLSHAFILGRFVYPRLNRMAEILLDTYETTPLVNEERPMGLLYLIVRHADMKIP